MITCQTAIEMTSQMKRGLLKYTRNYEKYLILEKTKIAQGHKARKYPSQDSNPGTRVLYSEPLH